MTIENPTYTLDELIVLEKKVTNNIASIADYNKIDDILNSMGLQNIIKEKMRESGIISYADYLVERKLNKIDTSTITGTILGVISALKRTLTNKLF
jgi:hypothetical protein